MPMVGVGMCCRPTANGDAARQGVLDWLLLGGRHVDDASMYGNQREVGLGIRQAVDKGVPRSEIFLVTKIPPKRFGFEDTTRWFEESMAELGLEYVDLVLLHSAGVPGAEGKACKEPHACRQEAWLALDRFKKQGKIKHLGVSNFGKRQIEELLSLKVAPVEVNQLEYHPWVPELHRETAQYCHEQRIVVTAYGSMGSAGNAAQMMMQDGLKQIGALHGKTAGQVLLRWAVQRNVSVIPGTSNPKHQAENLQLFDFQLAPQEMAMLDSIPESDRMLHFNHWPDHYP